MAGDALTSKNSATDPFLHNRHNVILQIQFSDYPGTIGGQGRYSEKIHTTMLVSAQEIEF
jgi:hypothetical protein